MGPAVLSMLRIHNRPFPVLVSSTLAIDIRLDLTSANSESRKPISHQRLVLHSLMDVQTTSSFLIYQITSSSNHCLPPTHIRSSTSATLPNPKTCDKSRLGSSPPVQHNARTCYFKSLPSPPPPPPHPLHPPAAQTFHLHHLDAPPPRRLHPSARALLPSLVLFLAGASLNIRGHDECVWVSVGGVEDVIALAVGGSEAVGCGGGEVGGECIFRGEMGNRMSS